MSVVVEDRDVLHRVFMLDRYSLAYADCYVHRLLAGALRFVRSNWNLCGASVSIALDGRSDTYACTDQGRPFRKARRASIRGESRAWGNRVKGDRTRRRGDRMSTRSRFHIYLEG